MTDDGWEDVTDPKELRQVLGASAANGGIPKLSTDDSKSAREARDANRDGRPVFKALAQTYRLAKRYPGGIPQTVYDKARLSTGSDNQTAQDFDLFRAMNIRAASAKAKLLGVNPTDKDLALTLQSVASPRYRFENNRELIGQDYQAAAQKYFENAFLQRWTQRFGGTNATDAHGRSYAEALSEALRSPEVSRQVTAPWNRKPIGGPRSASTAGWSVKR